MTYKTLDFVIDAYRHTPEYQMEYAKIAPKIEDLKTIKKQGFKKYPVLSRQQ